MASRERTLLWRRRLRVAVGAALATILLLAVLDRLGGFHNRDILRSLGLTGHAGGEWSHIDHCRFAVAAVVDERTVMLRDPSGREQAIRLLGLAEPAEQHRPAVAWLRENAVGREVLVRLEVLHVRGADGVIQGYLYVDGQCLGTSLVRSGWGRADEDLDHPHRATLMQAQQEARRRREGMWAPGAQMVGP